MILVLCPVGISWENIYDPRPMSRRDKQGEIDDLGPLYRRDQLGGHA
jgi:hypothetical protein